MSNFDERKSAQEAKFAHDQEFQMKATARRNKLLGLWAADLMGLAGADADTYAKSVVISDLQEAGDDDVMRKVVADLAAKGVVRTDAQVREQIAVLTPVAREQVMKELNK